MSLYLGNTLIAGASGGAGASLTADQTFTGANTFTGSIIVDSGTTLTGIASYETGTWTPSFQNTGTQTITNADYTILGNLATVSCSVGLGMSTSTNGVILNPSSLPFLPSFSSSKTMGTFHNAGLLISTDAGIVLGSSVVISFYKFDNTGLIGTDLGDTFSLTITYEIA